MTGSIGWDMGACLIRAVSEGALKTGLGRFLPLVGTEQLLCCRRRQESWWGAAQGHRGGKGRGPHCTGPERLQEVAGVTEGACDSRGLSLGYPSPWLAPDPSAPSVRTGWGCRTSCVPSVVPSQARHKGLGLWGTRSLEREEEAFSGRSLIETWDIRPWHLLSWGRRCWDCRAWPLGDCTSLPSSCSQGIGAAPAPFPTARSSGQGASSVIMEQAGCGVLCSRNQGLPGASGEAACPAWALAQDTDGQLLIVAWGQFLLG